MSYQISQLIQTPSDITIPTLIENEAPYAGMLAWSANLHAFDDRVADRLSLMLGIVGPLPARSRPRNGGTGSSVPTSRRVGTTRSTTNRCSR